MTCIVVKRGEFAHYERLSEAFSGSLPVLWDRRRTHQPGDTCESNPSRADRRGSPPASWDALGFIVSHPER